MKIYSIIDQLCYSEEHLWYPTILSLKPYSQDCYVMDVNEQSSKSYWEDNYDESRWKPYNVDVYSICYLDESSHEEVDEDSNDVLDATYCYKLDIYRKGELKSIEYYNYRTNELIYTIDGNS